MVNENARTVAGLSQKLPEGYGAGHVPYGCRYETFTSLHRLVPFPSEVPHVPNPTACQPFPETLQCPFSQVPNLIFCDVNRGTSQSPRGEPGVRRSPAQLMEHWRLAPNGTLSGSGSSSRSETTFNVGAAAGISEAARASGDPTVVFKTMRAVVQTLGLVHMRVKPPGPISWLFWTEQPFKLSRVKLVTLARTFITELNATR